MKRKLGVLFVLISVALTSCLTIEEIYHFNSDGSGNMKYVIDMSEMAGMMEAFKGEEGETSETGGEMQEAAQDLLNAGDKIKSISGISNVMSTQDDAKYIYTLSFDFSNVDALNMALNEFLRDSGDTKFYEFFSKKGKSITKKAIIADKMKGLNSNGSMDEEDESANEMMEMFLEQMKYNVTINFDKSVKSVKTESTSGSLSSDKKTYSIQTNFKSILDNPNELDLTLKTK